MGPVAEFCSEEAGSWKESWRTLSRFPPATSQFDLILGQNRSPIYSLDPPHVNLVDLCLPVILSYLRNSIVINVLDLKQSFNKVSFEGVSSFAYTSTQKPTSGNSILLAQFQPHRVPKVSHPHALGGVSSQQNINRLLLSAPQQPSRHIWAATPRSLASCKADSPTPHMVDVGLL